MEKVRSFLILSERIDGSVQMAIGSDIFCKSDCGCDLLNQIGCNTSLSFVPEASLYRLAEHRARRTFPSNPGQCCSDPGYTDRKAPAHSRGSDRKIFPIHSLFHTILKHLNITPNLNNQVIDSLS